MTQISDGTSESSGHSADSYRWLIIYRYYLYAALALSVIGIAKNVFGSFQMFGYFADDPFQLFVRVVWPLLVDGAQIGLFVFAIVSLATIGQRWVRTLHLWINGAAVVMGLFFLLSSVVNLSAVWGLWYASMFLQLFSIAVLPIGELVPWQYVYSNLGSEDAFRLVRGIISIVALAPAILWSVRWIDLHDGVPADVRIESATRTHDAQSSPTSVGRWLITLILISIPILNIILLLYWSFSSETPPEKTNFARAFLIFSVIVTILYFGFLFLYMLVMFGRLFPW